MNPSFLGQGLSYPLRMGGDGDFLISQDFEQIRESIEVILGTKLGERRMLPEFGSNLHLLLFESADPSTFALAKRYTADAIGKWEPRVSVEQIGIQPIVKDGDTLGFHIHIHYVVIRYNVADNLVYPFYVNNGQGA